MDKIKYLKCRIVNKVMEFINFLENNNNHYG